MDEPEPLILFEIETPLGFTVRCTESYWLLISTVKHDSMTGRLQDVKDTLADPDEVRRSTKDNELFIFYRSDEKRFVCVVVRRLNGDGFIITAYPTNKVNNYRLKAEAFGATESRLKQVMGQSGNCHHYR